MKTQTPKMNFSSISKTFNLTFDEIMEIARKEKWEITVLHNNRLVERAVVLNYFSSKGIAPTYISRKLACEIFDITDDQAFEAIKTLKLTPICKRGVKSRWTYPFSIFAEYFNK